MSEPVTVVTGSRKGIGRFLAERYLSLGHRVVGCSRTDTDLVSDAYEHHSLDVSHEDAVAKFFAAVRKRHGRLDHLVNAAGIASMNHSVLTSGATFRRIFEVNVFGTFYCSREAAKIMQRHRYGRIVNFGSIAVPLKLAGEAAYAASKAAIVSLSEVMARELAPFEITVNVVAPNAIDTDLIAGVPAERIEALRQRLAIARAPRLEELGAIVDFFLSPSSSMVTGQTVYMGGP